MHSTEETPGSKRLLYSDMSTLAARTLPNKLRASFPRTLLHDPPSLARAGRRKGGVEERCFFFFISWFTCSLFDHFPYLRLDHSMRMKPTRWRNKLLRGESWKGSFLLGHLGSYGDNTGTIRAHDDLNLRFSSPVSYHLKKHSVSTIQTLLRQQ